MTFVLEPPGVSPSHMRKCMSQKSELQQMMKPLLSFCATANERESVTLEGEMGAVFTSHTLTLKFVM